MAHTPFTRHFFIDGRFVATAPAGYREEAGKQLPPHSYSFVCGHCGEQWGRSPVAMGDSKPYPWNNLTHTCRKCTDRYQSRWRIPGSMWLGFDPSFTASFPAEVLKRELELHLKAYENDWN